MDHSSPVSIMQRAADEPWTPRTRVARMLADIDEEIENAPTPSSAAHANRKQPEHEQRLHATPQSPLGIQSVSNSPLDVPPNKHISAKTTSAPALDSDDSEDSVRRPNGRAARRMLTYNKPLSPSSPASSPFPAQSSLPQALSYAQDDEEDLYSATPMKQPSQPKIASLSSFGSGHQSPLFVSPTKSADADSEGELPAHPFGGRDKLAQLVAQKRAERLAREAVETERRKEAASAQPPSDLPDEAFENSQEPPDPDIERIMSDATRPSRKASKKALLEMERETQRIARQQALAHQMKVKKKYTTQDLFARFNFRQSSASKDTPQSALTDGETSASSIPNSDGIDDRPKQLHSTPPSSPPTPLDRQKYLVEQGALSKLVLFRQDSIASLAEIDADNEELPDIAEIMKSSQMPKDISTSQGEDATAERKGDKLGRIGKAPLAHPDSSDDELEILPRLPPHLRVFDKIAGAAGAKISADSRAIQRLKHLSNMHADDSRQRKKGARPSINPLTLDNQLRKHAKEQARQQEKEHIEMLKAKGIEVQTTEEREKEAEAYETLLEKARQDAVKLRDAEKAARTAANGEGAVQASDDEDEDEDYDYDGSGSEDEGDTEGARLHKDEYLIHGAADESTEDGEEEEEDEEEEKEDEEEEKEDEEANGNQDEQDEDEPFESLSVPEDDSATEATQLARMQFTTPAAVTRNVRKSRIVVDEDDEEEDEDGEAAYLGIQQTPATDEDPFAAFNFGPAGNANLLFSPTQAFNATMQTPTQLTQEDSFDILRRIAPPSLASLRPTLADLDTLADEATDSFAEESQVPESQRVNLQWETQPPETPMPANLYRDMSGLSDTPGWEPSQDPGLPSPWSAQIKPSTLVSNGEHDTQSTVRLRVSESPVPSQPAPHRGRLVRRKIATSDVSEDEDIEPDISARPDKKNAFREMARRRKSDMTVAERAAADKEMRGMMDEQAEESEDEYAGLGGDDYVAPETEEDKAMIDSSHVDVDERALAAHFAERQRLRDEEETSRLYKDVTTGVLRRKMGANAFDLEEDEDEMAARRRQIRQQEEARKRRALLKDVNVATLAEGRQSKGKDAFLRAIADDDGDEDIDRSDGEDEPAPPTQEDSQTSQSHPAPLGIMSETSGNKRRLVADDEDDEAAQRTKQRRTGFSAFRRPTSLLEVKESVSFLLEEPNAIAALELANAEYNSDSEGERRGDAGSVESGEESGDAFVAAEECRENDGGFAPNPISMEAKIVSARLPASQRRTRPKAAVVNRLSLKRGSTADSAHGRTAWAAGPTTGGFKVPSLIRRATSSSALAGNERGVPTASLSRENSGVKMGGTKKSSLAYQARAEERRAIVEASAKRREENTARIAQLRRHSSALNRGLSGSFE